MKDLQRVGPAEVEEIYGVPPDLVPDFVALRGDPSDKIPGAKGVGPGRAAGVLKKHGSLDAALESGGFPDQADALRDYLHIATLQYEAEIPELPDAEPDWSGAGDLLGEWGLNAASKRFHDRAAQA